MEYLEVDEDGSYGLAADGKWYITPLGLAMWLDDEGGVFSFIQGRGISDLVEAGVDELVAQTCEDAMWALKRELARIGAVL
jgi:hypothetical protein